jgi:hypothetical protein
MRSCSDFSGKACCLFEDLLDGVDEAGLRGQAEEDGPGLAYAFSREYAMDEKHRISGFKALLKSHKRNSYHLEESDGDFQLWRDLSAEGRLKHIVRDAAFYDVPFEQFAEAVRESVDNAAIEEAALRLAMRSGRELHDLEALVPDDTGSNFPPTLMERVEALVHAEKHGRKSFDKLLEEKTKAPATEKGKDRDIVR